MKKISVIGNVMLDQYIIKGILKEHYGGILYVLSVLSLLFNKKAEIFPISIINNQHYDEVFSILRHYKNINISNIKKINQKMNTFEMYYDKDGHYYNSLCYFNNKLIPYRSIKPHLDSDIIIISFIAGNDVELLTLKKIAQNGKSLIFGDIHNFIYDPPVRGIKTFKTIKFWKDWVDCFDIIQGSTFEWEFLLKDSNFSGKVKHLLQYPSKGIKRRFQEVAKYILNKKRPKILILTDGKYGAHVFYKKEGKIISIYESALLLDNVKGITGCGDSFSGAFLFQYSQTGDVRKALRFAVQISSLKTQFLGLWNKKEYNTIKKKYFFEFKF